MRLALCLSLPLMLAAPLARADVALALRNHILPGFADFAAQTTVLAEAAELDCRPRALVPAYHAAYDAWMKVADLRIGPSESGLQTIVFWPDDQEVTRQALRQVIVEAAPMSASGDLSDVTEAARGLLALEMLLFDPEFSQYRQGSQPCALARAMTVDLAVQARDLHEAWSGAFAETLTSAGEAGNEIYPDAKEAFRVLYAQIMFSLEFNASRRLGHPMGTEDHPLPQVAEAWRSSRSLRNVLLSIDAAENLALMLSGGALPTTRSATIAIHEAADRVQNPGFRDLDEAGARFPLEILQGAIRKMREAIQEEIGTPNGIVAGLTPRDEGPAPVISP